MSISYYEWSMLVLRIILGFIFLMHGVQKVSNIEGIIAFFTSLGLPAILAYVVAAMETIGGGALILGFFTRIAATGISFVLLGAIFTVKTGKGLINGYEFEVSLLAICLALIISGSQTFALDKLFGSSSVVSSNKKTL